MSVGVLFEQVSYRAVLGLLVARYLEIKLKKEQAASTMSAFTEEMCIYTVIHQIR